MGAKGSSLCDPCRSLCSNKASLDLLNSSSGYTRHGAIPYLQQSSKAGCPLCSMLSDGRFLSSKDPVMTQVYEDPSTFRRNRKVMLKGTRGLSKYSMNKDHDLGGVELWVDIMSPYNDVLLKSAEVIIKYSTKEKAEEHIKNLDLKHHWIKLMTFKADVKRDTSHKTCGAREVILSEPDSERAWTHVKGWVEECSDHDECILSERPELPRRVIVVSDADGKPILKLHETTGQKDDFIALSYCWGGPQKPVTDKSTLAVHLNALDEKGLPQTIQDAIKVTRKLGFRYLWVDALCIIQDSGEDKMIEITKMHQYYKNASLTVIAATAERAGDGFLERRTTTACTLPYFIDGEDKEAVVQLMPLVDDPDSLGSVDSKSAVTIRSPIVQRAWTLQESTLSRRKLTYGARGIDWACRHQRAFMSGDNVERQHGSGQQTLDPPAFDFFATNHRPSMETMVQSWRRVVEDYTSRSLTVSDDKLPAVSAIAQAFQQDSGWLYLAGLWSGSLQLDLLWFVESNEHNKSAPKPARAKTYRAPSWSWASMDGQIAMNKADVQIVASQVVSVYVPVKDIRAPFGQVLEGSFIDVLGLVKKSVSIPEDFWQKSDICFRLDTNEPEGDEVWFLWLCTRDYNIMGKDKLIEETGIPDWIREAMEKSETEGMKEALKDDTANKEYIKNSKPEAAGLILVPAKGTVGAFRRVGIFLEIPEEAFKDVTEPSIVRIV